MFVFMSVIVYVCDRVYFFVFGFAFVCLHGVGTYVFVCLSVCVFLFVCVCMVVLVCLCMFVQVFLCVFVCRFVCGCVCFVCLFV